VCEMSVSRSSVVEVYETGLFYDFYYLDYLEVARDDRLEPLPVVFLRRRSTGNVVVVGTGSDRSCG